MMKQQSHSSGGNRSTQAGGLPHLLAWRWLFAALAVFLVATVVAWTQEPRPVPLNRGHLGFTFMAPMETSPHRRLLTVFDNLNDVLAQDNSRVWAVGNNGRLLATVDGGKNWHVQESGTNENLQRIIFHPDGLRGWAGSIDRSIIATQDGGKSWHGLVRTWPEVESHINGEAGVGKQVSPFPPDFDEPPGRLSNRTQGEWTIGDGGTIALIPAAGQPPLPASYGHAPLLDVAFAPGHVFGWGVGERGTIIATTDGGRTWTAQTSTTQAPLYNVRIAADGLHAWAAGELGTVLASTDGGRSWTSQRTNIRDNLFLVIFLEDHLHGWAAGGAGVIIATRDGGKTWTKQISNTTANIIAMGFSRDGKTGWATDMAGNRLVTSDSGDTWKISAESGGAEPIYSIGFSSERELGWGLRFDSTPSTPEVFAGGTLVNSRDGGKSWEVPAGVSSMPLRSVSFAANGKNGVAIPKEYFGRIILTTDNGGVDWEQRHFPSMMPLTLKLLPDGQRGLAVTVTGQILATDDGGLHWRDAERYSRYPAFWYWLAVALSALMAWMAWRLRPAGPRHESVADVAASDAEIRRLADDQLNFGGLARGISRFLRNTETQPPLTLAVTGDWGSGKSSLMRLVCADLRRFGHRPIWFNAWHHQKEEHLFAALLGAIHAQAVPPLSTVNGLSFRLRLLWERSRRHFWVMMIVVALFTGLVLFSIRAFETGGIGNVTVSLNAVREMAAPPLGAVSALFAAVTALFALAKGTSAFGVNPALLLDTARSHMSLKTAAAQNNFRDRFAQQFDELTSALPYRLVVIVDDLDRCHPSAVIEVMEAVNYLTSAGKCFVIFGMASERVTAALGLAFKDIAAEMVQMEAVPDSPNAKAAEAALELARRRAYATDYLQKLVNIEVKVPSDRGLAHHRLLVSPEPEPRRRVMVFISDLARLAPLAAACVAVALGAWLAHEIGDAQQGTPRAPDAAVTAQVPPAGAPPSLAGPATPSGTRTEEEQIAAVRAPLGTRDGEDVSPAAKLAWSGLAFAPLLAVAGLIVLLLLRGRLYETRDSVQFHEALEIWTPVVASKRGTPRAIKRFGNRLRYLAMLQQGEEQEKTFLDLLQEKLKRWRRKEDPGESGSSSQGQALSEYQLIALGAFQEVCGTEWKEQFANIFPPHWGAVVEETGRQDDQLVHALKRAAKAHQNRFDSAWPPSAAEIATFEKLVAGVRLSGDPRADRRQAREQDTVRKRYREARHSSEKA
jgi:photosystem II stability/assembly factor-like uncharacterized protein